MYFLKSRYYDPETGRFISPDGIEYADPETINGLNLYAYCGNNPVMNVDPDGHIFWLFFFIGAAINIATQLITTGTVDIGKVLLAGLFSGIGGIVGGMLVNMGANIGVQVIAQGVISLAETAAQSLYQGKELTFTDVATALITGGFFGLLGAKSPAGRLSLPAIKSFWGIVKDKIKQGIEVVGKIITDYLLSKGKSDA